MEHDAMIQFRMPVVSDNSYEVASSRLERIEGRSRLAVIVEAKVEFQVRRAASLGTRGFDTGRRM